MVKAAYIPDAGHLIWVDFNPHAGHEQSGRRPGLVLSPASYNRKTNLAVICPITSQQKGYPFEVPLLANGSIKGVVLVDHLKNLDWKHRNAEYAGSVSAQLLDQVRMRILPLLGIEN